MSKSIKNKIILQSQIPQLPNQERLSKNRMSGHFVDLRLKNEYQQNKKELEPIWNSLSNDNQNKINDEKIIEGINLTVAEDRLIHSILNIFHKKQTPENFGNLKNENINFGNISLPIPRIKINPTELYSEVTGKINSYSGKEIENVKSVLQKLANQKFLIIYKRHRQQGKNIVIDRIEEYQSILTVNVLFEGISQKEDYLLDKGDLKTRQEKEQFIISLNPIFIDQIDTKFVEYPININLLTDEAAGGSRNVNQAMINLRNYILRIISSNKKSGKKTFCFSINKEKLIYTLHLENYIKQGRKKQIETRLSQSFDLCQKMGLISNIKLSKSIDNKDQYSFDVNLKF